MNAFGFAGIVVVQEELRLLHENRPVLLVVAVPRRARGADDLFWRDAVDLRGVHAHEVLAAAGDDVRLEAVRAQVLKYLQHRLIDQIGVRTMPARVGSGRKPLLRCGGEVFDRHPRERRGENLFEVGRLSPAIASWLPESTVLKGSTSFSAGCFATTAGTRSRA